MEIEFSKAFDLNFLVANQDVARSQVLSHARKPGGHSIVFANAHVVVETNQDPTFKKDLQKATMVFPDGTPIAWLLRAQGKPAVRYSGPDLMNDLLTEDSSHKHFLLGSTPEVLTKLQNRYGSKITGTFSPPFKKEFTEAEKDEHIERVRSAGADFIWVGLGAPKQEKYVLEMAARANHGVWLAVGAAFDFLSGEKRRAPQLLQKFGLEWAFRWANEPSRLTHRYLSTNPKFITLLAREYFGRENH